MEIKVKKLKESLKCDDAFISKLMESFLEETNESMEHMHEGLKSVDYSKIRGAAHKMIGSCNIFEFDEMIDILKTMEKNSESKVNLKEISEKFISLQNLHKEANDIMHDYISKTEA